jgi:hypothetical protein
VLCCVAWKRSAERFWENEQRLCPDPLDCFACSTCDGQEKGDNEKVTVKIRRWTGCRSDRIIYGIADLKMDKFLCLPSFLWGLKDALVCL